MLNHRLTFPLTLVLFVFIGWCYALASPPLESSDEYKHYPVVQFVQTNGRLPVLDPANPGKWLQEGAQPPLYYLLMAAVTYPINTSDLDEVHQRNPHAYVGNAAQIKNKNLILHNREAEGFPWQGTILAIYLIRAASLGLGMVTLWLIVKVGELVFSRPVGVFAAILTAFNPMFLFVHAAVNNDSLSILLGTAGLYLLIYIWQELPDPRAGWRYYVWLGVVCGLGLLTKLSLGGILLLAGVATALRAYQTGRWHFLFVGGVTTASTSLLIAGWWIWRNWSLYGDLTGLAPFIAVQGTRDNPTLGGVDWVGEWGTFYRTYWGLFGGINVISPNIFYVLSNWLLLIGLLSAAFWFWRNWKHRPIGWWLLPAWVGILFVLLIRWNIISPAFQGRLVFPGIAAINLLWAMGLTHWLSAKKKDWLVLGMGGFFALWAVILPWTHIAPAYAYPESTTVPSEATFGPISYLLPNGEALSLVGVEIPSDQTTVANGRTGIDVTLYWQADTPLSQNYVTSVHLLGRGLADVAQVDRYPGWGMWPTSEWEAGEIWEEPYRLWIEGDTAVSPSRLLITADLIDAEALDINGNPIPLVVIGEARLGQPERPQINSNMGIPFADGITLLDVETMAVDGSFVATLWWQADGVPQGDYTVFVQLLDTDGAYLMGADAPPVNGDYPTRLWQPGDVIDDQHIFPDVSTLSAGSYQLAVGLYEPTSGVRLPRLDSGDVVLIPIELK